MYIHAIELVSNGVELVSNGVELVSNGVELVSDGVELVSDGVELVSDGVELISNGVELVSNGVEQINLLGRWYKNTGIVYLFSAVFIRFETGKRRKQGLLPNKNKLIEKKEAIPFHCFKL